MLEIIKRFKGGSLSSTNLMSDDKGLLFVRKSVSLIDNREYGFQRWYSQLKKMQRYSVQFPGVFPNVINFGKNSDVAYFDIEYFPGGVNAQDFIESCKNKDEIDTFFEALIITMQKLHSTTIESDKGAIDLYIHEEIEQRIEACDKNKTFTDFLKHKKIIFNGVPVDSFIHLLDQYKAMFNECYINVSETFTHGNITLENILYIPDEERVILIDPYEENIIDSVLAEYSQLLQSTNSKYEMYNSEYSVIKGNQITLELKESFGINYLNDKIFSKMNETFTKEENIAIRLFEVSQFIRMLPFKMEVDESKMIFFYGLASYLFDIVKKDYSLIKKASDNE